jgi:hypothetical protein
VLQYVVALAAAMGSSQAAVTVTFHEPEKFTDVGRYRNDTDATLKTLEGHLQNLGKQYLPPNENLAIEILDVDLAGEERFRGTQNVRIQHGGADWPRIRLRYTLERDGRKEPAREEMVSDMNYQWRPLPSVSEALGYEKRMLEEWFRKRFEPQRLPSTK